MAYMSGVGPNNPPHNPHPKDPTNTPNSQAFSEAMNKSSPRETDTPSGKPFPQSFAQTAWGFDAEEAKKFISTLANTLITQIKHEDEKIKETADELKQAELGEDQ